MLTTSEQATVLEAREILRRFISDKPILSSYASVIDYLAFGAAGAKREVFRVLFLDRRNRLIEDWEAGIGTISFVAVYPREIMAKALELSSSAIILSHNHPSGDPTPSAEDVSMTKKIIEAANVFDITVHDHVIVGADGDYSMRAHGQI